MTEEFMKANPEKYYFNFKEIIVQTLPKSYRERIEKEIEFATNVTPFESEKRNPATTIENEYCDPMQRKVKKVMENLGINIEKYKDQKGNYKIPILFAEMIYVLAKTFSENTSKNSFASYLFKNEFELPSTDDKKELINSTFEELKKDYPHISEKANKMQIEFMYPYNKINKIKEYIKHLEKIQNSIGIPMIGYDEILYNKWDDFFNNLRDDIKDTEYYDYIINHPGHQLLQHFYSLSGTTEILSYDEELEKALKRIEKNINQLEKELNRVIEYSKLKHNNHSFYLYLTEEQPK